MNLPDRARSTASAVHILALVVVSVVTLACASPSQSPTPGATASASPTVDPSEAPVATPTATADPVVGGIPTGCYGLGPEDCRFVSDHVATQLTEADPPIVHLQIGPFSCPDGQRCPTTLVARPEGDVTAEFAGGAVSFHIKAVGGELESSRQEAFGVSLPPTSEPPLPAGPKPHSLGHCGLWSGVDLGGSWWDPVGPIDAEHADTINAAEGTIVFIDPDHALFTSRGGLSVSLLRHRGEKFLPLCQ